MRAIDYFDRGASLHPKREAFVHGQRAVTYEEAQAFTHKVALALKRHGAGVGTKVAVYSPNSIDAFLVVLGALRAGAIWVPINVRNGLEENLLILQNTGCSVLFYHSDFEAAASAMCTAEPAILGVRLDHGGGGAPLLSDWSGLLEGSMPSLPLDNDRLCAILSTGGTTGKPKGVMWRDQTLETMVANFWAHMPCEKPPVYLVAAPMTHAAGVIGLPLLAAGATIVLLERADPLEIMIAIQRHGVTHLFLPPTVVYLMLAHPRVKEFDYSSLLYFIYSAAPMAPAKIREAIETFGPVMAQAYGQAEFPLMGTFLSPKEHVEIMRSGPPERLESAGRPCMFTKLAVVDDGGVPIAPREIGEIVLSGNQAMVGYYNDPSATRDVTRDGWHHTGDLGYLDEDGFLYIVDRKKDMIITGGFNVYSAEVERILLAHPLVQDCAVVGVPDEKWGEAVKAVVEAKPGQRIEPEALIQHCRDRLGSVKAPKSLEVWPQLPRSPVGKVLKRKIRDSYWTGRSRQV